MKKQKDRHLFKQKSKQKSANCGGFLFVFLILMVASVFGMAVPATEAAFGINRQINYQGRLMDSSGISVGDGSYQMQFKLYSQASGGSHIWSASTTNGLPTGTPADVTVDVKNGLFTILLGNVSGGQVPLDIDWNQDTIYLGVKIGTDSEMVPRKRLTAVPYALNAEMLQGQHASSSIANTGGNLFALNQSANDAATALRTALFVETQGTSNVYDYLLRMSDGSSDVFTVNRQGHATTTGSFALGGNLSVQGIRLDSVGSNPLTSGAYLVGVYDEFTYSNATTVQAALNDLDATIDAVSSSAAGLTLQDVTNNGNTTTNPLIFAGGTSSGDLMPGAHLTYDLGQRGNRWDELWVRRTRIGTNSWTLEADGNNTFLISEDTNGIFFAITENGKVGIGTSTPQFFTLEVNGTVGPAQNNLFDLGSASNAWRNIIAQGTVSSTNGLFGSATIGNLSVTDLTVANQLDLSELVWSNATGTYSILGSLTVTSTLTLPNNSVTDSMVSDALTIDQFGNVSATSVNSGVLGNSNVILDLDAFGEIRGGLNASQITLAATNTSNTINIQQYLNMLIANGRAFGGDVMQTASGTLQVSAGEGLIASDPYNPGATVYYTSWATSSGINVPFYQWLNIYIHYDSTVGVAAILATTTAYNGDWTYFKIAKVYNDGDGLLHIHDERSIETRPINRIVDFLENGIGQTITHGCLISDVGTRNIAISQCTNWYAAYERVIASFDSSGTDTFERYYRNGSGGFIHTQGHQQWDNLNYDNNSGTLQPLGGDEYGVHWVYIHEHGAISLLYGQEAYTDLANAQAAQPPSVLPDEFLNQEHAFLIGAIIFEQGENPMTAIRDMRPILLNRDGSSGGSGVINHNDLSGIQGGAIGEYYHLTANGFDADTSLLFSANNGGSFGLEVNTPTNTKITINNTFAGTASLDIIDGDLMLASTTRITNSGAAYFTNLNLASNLYVSGTALLSTLTLDSATTTNLFTTNGVFTNLTAGILNLTDLFWDNATGTNANIGSLTGTSAVFTNLIATNATFTKLVVMDNTSIKNLEFTNATGGNLVTYGTVSSTYIKVQESELGYATAHNMVVDESLRVGVGDFPVIGNSVAQFGGTTNTYLQVNIQNHSSGTDASADYVATADIGDDESYYVDLGINNSNYDNADFSISGPLDAYLYAYSANLTIGTASASSDILFHAGGSLDTDEVMRITADHYVGIGTSTPSHTLDVDGDGRFTGLLTLSSATTTELFWNTATGTDLTITSIARLPANTTIGSKSVCLLDGTNCPSATSPDFQTVTNTGNTTTNWIEFAGGTSTADFRFSAGLTIDGHMAAQTFNFTHATGSNLFLSGMVSSTSLYSGDAYLANTIMANATAANMIVQTLKVGSGNFPVLGASIAQFGGDFNNYLVVNARNTNTGNFATANFTASADVATPGNNFNTTMGIANSGFNSPFFTIANPLDSYLMGNSNDLLIVAATSSSMIKFAAGGTLAADEVMRITADHYVGIGTTNPSSTLDVLGDARISNILTVKTATTSNLFWGEATGTILKVTGLARLPSDTLIGNKSICLLDGTNCPSGTTPSLQTVTNTGNTTTHALQFAGGTSTADFRFQQNIWIDGNVSSTSALFVNATGTYIDFITTADNPAYFEGRLFYDQYDGALSYYNGVSDITVNIAEESLIKVYNDTGSIITNGQVVYITGADNDGHPTIALASAASSSTARIMGMATHDIGIGDHGYITRFGKVHFLDTSSFATGTSLYLSAVTPGFYTATRPESPGITVEVGVVVKSHATEGIILVSLGVPRNGKISEGGIAFGTGNDYMTDDAGNFYWNNTSKRLGIGTNNPSSTLHVIGTTQVQDILLTHASGTSLNLSGLMAGNKLTVNQGTSTYFTFTEATGTSLYVSGPIRLSLNTRINGVLPCLQDGTNCPSSAASNLQTVTNAGNTTTHALQFNGGTSTANFRIQGDLTVTQKISGNQGLFINVTSTNLALLGRINSNLLPMATDSYTLGNSTYRWLSLNVRNATTTSLYASGYVSSSAIYINGIAVTTSVPTLQQVTAKGNITSDKIVFGGGTSTGFIVPGTDNSYNLGSTNYRWSDVWGANLHVGTSTAWDLTKVANGAFTISKGGSEKLRVTNDGNLYVGTTAYSGGLGTTFSPNGNEILANGDIGALGSVYAGTSFRAGATSTVYSKSSLYKQDGGDYLFQFANVATTPESITSFESSFPPADWSTGGDANWFQDSSTSTEGTYSAQSGNINDLEISYIETDYTFSSDGLLEFEWKVSSEATYDFLLFCIDNAINCTDAGAGDYARIDGETNWATVSVPITAGTHNLRWAYDKDYSISNGSDAGWIDNVRFSPYSGQNWRFFTNATERLTVAYSGNVGIGISVPTAKLDINGDTKARGNVTITAAPSKTETAWTSSNKTTTGIESVRSLVAFNGYLYAGQGDGAGDGDIQVCNPAGGGSATICDNAGDWSASYSTASYSQVLAMIVYKGRLYAGLGNGAGLGDVVVCNPATTGGVDTCDVGDWSDAAFPAGPNRITQLIEYNGYLYASNDTGVAGSASVAICNPAGGGTATACDNAADWTNIALPVAGFEEVNSMVIYKNAMYAFVGNSLDDSDLFICDPTSAGVNSRCDNAADWTRPFDNTAGTYETSYSAAVYNGYMYVGRGLSSSDGDLLRCEPQAAGSDALCDNAGDFTTALNNGAGITGITALMSYDGSLYIGQEGSTNNGDIIEMTGAIYKTSDVATGLEATYAFTTLNGVLYAGRGNSTGDGQVYFYQKARESSYALNFQASSSTGSMWFSSQSLNYQGVGTSYDTQSGVFKFSHGIITEAGSYDLAEMYPTTDESITAGDVVVLDGDNAGYVGKADKVYDKKLLGVVSTKPGFLLSGPKDKNVISRAIALVGRVPVKISTENGDIEIGDPLTSASVPGYAMKATKPGMILGHAMEAFTSSTTSTVADSNGSYDMINMVVQTGYYFGSNETSLGQIAGFLGETTSTQIIQQAFDGDAYAIEQIRGGLVNPQVADGSALNNASSAQLDVLIVRTAALIAGDLTVGGDSKLLGHVIVTNDVAGVVDLPIGQSSVEIRFSKPFEGVPVVVVTPESDANEYITPWLGRFRISNKTKDGFRIEVDEGACFDPTNCGRTMRFNWMAVGLQAELANTSTTTENISIAEQPVPDESVDVTDSTDEEPIIDTQETSLTDTNVSTPDEIITDTNTTNDSLDTGASSTGPIDVAEEVMVDLSIEEPTNFQSSSTEGGEAP